MLQMPSEFSFYKLPEKKRRAMIGKCFTTANAPGCLHWPIGLADGEFNYGVDQGLIFVTGVRPHGLKPGEKWFRVGVASPDDLDMDLDFDNDEIHLHPKVIEFLKKMPKTCLRYREVLLRVQERVRGGRMTS